MKSPRHKQIEKARFMIANSNRKKWIELIKEENNGVFIHPLCSGCGEHLDLLDDYSRNYGFCSVDCGMRTFGLSWSDFY